MPNYEKKIDRLIEETTEKIKILNERLKQFSYNKKPQLKRKSDLIIEKAAKKENKKIKHDAAKNLINNVR
jgi:hypothetical protein